MRFLKQQATLKPLALSLLVVLCLSMGTFAQAAGKYEAKLIGRWVVDSESMCNAPQFKGAGFYFFLR